MVNEELINKVKNRDMEAFRRLYDLYREKVYFTAYSILKDKGMAEDVLQEVFIKVYTRIGDLKQVFKFDAWIYRIAANEAKSQYSRKREVLYSPVDEEIDSHFDIADESEDSIPEEIVLSRETSKELIKYIYELPEYQRLPLILFYYNNLSIEDISFIMECSAGTVKSRLFHGKKALKEKLIDADRVFKSCLISTGKRYGGGEVI